MVTPAADVIYPSITLSSVISSHCTCQREIFHYQSQQGWVESQAGQLAIISPIMAGQGWEEHRGGVSCQADLLKEPADDVNRWRGGGDLLWAGGGRHLLEGWQGESYDLLLGPLAGRSGLQGSVA